MKDISVELELKYIQAQTLKIKRIHYAVTFCFGSRSVDWMFDSLVVAITFLLFRWLVPFLFTVFFRSFSPWFHCPYFFRRNHYCDCKTSCEFNELFLFRALGMSEACVSLVSGVTQLTTALMRCDKFSKLKVPLTTKIFSLKKSTSFPNFISEKIISIDKILAFLQAFEHVISMFKTARCGIWVGLLMTSLREPSWNTQETFDWV